MFKRFTNACVRVVNRWLPDAFLFAVILTFVVYVAALFATGMGPIKAGCMGQFRRLLGSAGLFHADGSGAGAGFRHGFRQAL